MSPSPRYMDVLEISNPLYETRQLDIKMGLDLFYRAEDWATIQTIMTSAPFEAITGDLSDPDDPDNMVKIPSRADWLYFPIGDVQIVPGTDDHWAWLRMRLRGDAEVTDLDGADDQEDRWDRSTLTKWMSDNGTQCSVIGCAVYEHVLGNGKRIQQWRGLEMDDGGIMFSVRPGGNSY